MLWCLPHGLQQVSVSFWVIQLNSFDATWITAQTESCTAIILQIGLYTIGDGTSTVNNLLFQILCCTRLNYLQWINSLHMGLKSALWSNNCVILKIKSRISPEGLSCALGMILCKSWHTVKKDNLHCTKWESVMGATINGSRPCVLTDFPDEPLRLSTCQ